MTKDKVMLADKFEWVIDSFSFNNVKDVMDCLNLRWGGISPSRFELEDKVRDMFDDMLLNNLDDISCGGFRLEKLLDGNISLCFIIEEQSSEWM